MFGRRNSADSMSERRINRLDGRPIRYAVRRRVSADGNTDEIVLGREGFLGTAHGLVTVTCGGREVFRGDRTARGDGRLTVSELMSLDGVMIRGRNDLTGEPDVVVAYYADWRLPNRR